MPPRSLRPALLEDLPTLLRLVADFYRHFGYPYSEQEKRRLLSQVLEDPSLGRLSLVLSEAGEPAGYVYLTHYFSLELGGAVAIIDELFIDPAERGRGIGSRVVRQLIEIARERGVRALQLEAERTNPRAVALYEKLGFVDAHRHLLRLVLEPAPPASTS